MENAEIGNDIVRLDSGFLMEDENNVRCEYILNSGELLDEENSLDGMKNAPLREQDRFLPIANIVKIMKRVVPDNGKIGKDARECIQECISEFISFITSEASERCQAEKRKTINGEDVLYALNTLGFDNYVEPISIYLKKYREIVLAPVPVNKNSKTIILYGENYTSGDQVENDNEANTESAVLYSYP